MVGGATVVAGAMAGIVVGAGKLATAGESVLKLRDSFNSLAEAAGLVPEKLLADLQQATEGGIANFELFGLANKALALDLQGLGVDFVDLSAKVNKLADVSGADAKVAIEQFTQALGQGKVAGLASLGVVVDQEQALIKYAKSIGRTTEELTKQEKNTALATATMLELEAVISQLGPGTDNAGKAFGELSRAFRNLVDGFLVGFTTSESLTEAFRDLATTLEQVNLEEFGRGLGELASIFVNLTDVVAKFGVAIYDAGVGLKNLVTSPGEFFSGLYGDLGKVADIIKRVSPNVISLGAAFGKELAKPVEDSTEATKNLNTELDKAEYNKLTYELRAYGYGLDEVERKATGLTEAQKQAKREAEQLRREVERQVEAYEKLSKEIDTAARLGPLEDAVSDAASALNGPEFDRAISDYGKALYETTYQSMLQGQDKALAEGKITTVRIAEDAQKATNEKLRGLQKDFADNQGKELARANQEAFEKTADIFEQVITGVVDGNLKETLERMLIQAAIRFGAELAAQSALNLAGSLGLGSIGLGAGGAGLAGGGAGVGGAGLAGGGVGAGLGGLSAALGPLAAIIASIPTIQAGYNAGSPAQGFKDAPFYFKGAGLIGGAYGSVFGSGKSDEQRERDFYREKLREQGITNSQDQFRLFGGKEVSLSPGTEFTGLDSGAEGFAGLGNVLSIAQTGGIQENLSALFANALAEAENFNVAMLTTNSLLNQFGLDATTAQDLVTQSFLDGKISIDEYNATFNQLTQLASEDLPSIADGVALLGTATLTPREQIKALELTFKELSQAGITDTASIVSYLDGQWGAEVASVFQEAAGIGITSFEDFKNLSTPQIQAIANILAKLPGTISTVGDAGKRGFKEVGSGAGEAETTVKSLNQAVGILDRESDSSTKRVGSGFSSAKKEVDEFSSSVDRAIKKVKELRNAESSIPNPKQGLGQQP